MSRVKQLECPVGSAQRAVLTLPLQTSSTTSSYDKHGFLSIEDGEQYMDRVKPEGILVKVRSDSVANRKSSQCEGAEDHAALLLYHVHNTYHRRSGQDIFNVRSCM